MKNFRQWKNKKQFMEFDLNPNAPAIPSKVSTGLERGASSPVVPAGTPNTAGTPNASLQSMAPPKVSSTVLSRVDWLLNSLEELPASKIVQVQSYLMRKIQESLAKRSKASGSLGARAGLNTARDIRLGR